MDTIGLVFTFIFTIEFFSRVMAVGLWQVQAQFGAVWCSAVQCGAVWCNVL